MKLDYFTWRNTDGLNAFECQERIQELVISLMSQYCIDYYEALPQDENNEEYKVVLCVRDKSSLG